MRNGPKLSKQYPELLRFASQVEADKTLGAWRKQLLKMPVFWLGLIGYACTAALAIVALLFMLRRWVNIPSSMYGGLVGGITGGSGVVAVSWFWRHRCHRFLRQKLVDRGVPICLKCGYDLRGQIEPRCPECGTPFDPSLLDPSKSQ